MWQRDEYLPLTLYFDIEQLKCLVQHKIEIVTRILLGYLAGPSNVPLYAL